MDEPFGALDAQTREDLQEEILRIWQEEKNTIIQVTHNIEEAVYLADRIFIMTARPGKLRELIVVDAPRPRLKDAATSHKFVELCNHVRGVLRAEGARAEKS
jgi:NitT/TauT family transport system ATP-binding protein